MSLGYESILRRDANAMLITDRESYLSAKGELESFQNELMENLMLNDEEIVEFDDCVTIIQNKIDEFIKNNPEYGI